MGKLKEKSEFNILADEVLQKENLYAPSVHCSYYSCLQLMKVTINEFFEISYDDLETIIRESREKLKLNTHTYIIKHIGDEIRNYSKEEHTKFERNIKLLKVFRETSDYQDIQITSDQSSKAYVIAAEVRKQISQIFNV